MQNVVSESKLGLETVLVAVELSVMHDSWLVDIRKMTANMY